MRNEALTPRQDAAAPVYARPSSHRRTLALIMAAVGAVTARAQRAEPPASAGTAPPLPWSASNLANPIMDHLVGRIADQYRFDDAQRARMQKLVRERFSAWVGDNLSAIQPALDEFAAVQQSNDAPQPEHIGQWAERVLPLVRSFADTYSEAADEMRGFLRGDQIDQLDRDRAAFAAGLAIVNDRLTVWQEGGFDPAAEWSADPEVRRAMAEEQRIEAEQRVAAARNQARASATAAVEAGSADAATHGPTTPLPPSPAPAGVAPALDEWERYVEDFIQRYDLTEEQQQQAHRFLRERRQNRDEYRRRNAASVAEAQRLAAGGEGPERARAKATTDRLANQTAEQFRRLKTQLETIPTRQQRRAAHAQPAAARPASQRTAP